MTTRGWSLSAIIPVILLAALLTACGQITQPQTEGLQPLPSDTAESLVASQPTLPEGASGTAEPALTSTAALIPIDTPSTALATPPPSTTDLLQETQSAFDFGTADIAIIRPGQLSRHISPIRVIANLNTVVPVKTDITLFGEDGRVLTSKTLWSKPYDDPVNGNLITDIEFSIPVLAETARLELKAYDETGRVWALNSVYQILLSRGITDRNYAPEIQDRILLQLPFPDQREVSSSPIFISGMVRTSSDTPISVWLVDEHGTTVGEGQASVVLSPGSPYGQFVGEIPYQVSSLTTVWMTFGVQEGRIPGLTYLKTIEFTLLPDD